jgi:hypothetical protein
VVLGKGAHVMITRNLWQRKGLGHLGDYSDGENFTCSLVFTGIVNAAVGTVEDIIWECGAESSDLPLTVLVSCKDYKGPTLWRTEARERFPLGIPDCPNRPFEDLLQITVATTGYDSVALTVSLGSDCSQITRFYAAQNQIGNWNEEFFVWPDF